MIRLRHILLLLLQLSFLLVKGQVSEDDSLLNIIQTDRQDRAEIRALNTLAFNYVRTDLGRAKAYLFHAMALAEKLNSNEQLSNSYAGMVTLQMNQGRADSAGYYLHLIDQLAAATGSQKIKSDYNSSAGLFYRLQDNFKVALPYMLASVALVEQQTKKEPTLANRVALAGQYLNIGNVYNGLGQYRQSLQCHLKSLQIFEETGNKKGISYCYQNVGGDFLMLGQFSRASSYTTRSILLKKEMNDQRGISTALEQMGSICLGLSQYDSALYYYNESLKIAQGLKLLTGEANIYSNMAKACQAKKDFANAAIYFRDCQTLARQLGDSSMAAAADVGLASVNATAGRQRQAEKEMIGKLNASVRSGDMTQLISNYQVLADHYADTRQFEKALDYMQKYHHLSDSIKGGNVQLQINRMEQQYNAQKSQAEIALLKKDQQLTHLSLEKQKAFQYGAVAFVFLLVLIGWLVINRYRLLHKTRRVIEMEKMRNHIARDLHDDIGSTVTSINILSNTALQARGKEKIREGSWVAEEEPIGGKDEPATKEEMLREGEMMRASLEKIRLRSSSVMESMGDIVWAIDPLNEPIGQLLLRMQDFASGLLEPLDINFIFGEQGDFSPIKLDIRKRKDLYMLFKEAVTNAAKYSGCANLRCRLSHDGDSLRMEITDDGKGFDERQIVRGNGLKNMRQRAVSMAGRIRISSAPGEGTRIVLDLPLTIKNVPDDRPAHI